MTPPGPRYPARSRRNDILRGAQLGVSVRRAEAAKPVPMALTATRRGLLEAVAAGKVKYHWSSGWRCGGKTVNDLVRQVVAAGWAKERLNGAPPIERRIALTAEGEKAIGAGEPA
jgi:hypothetical protein